MVTSDAIGLAPTGAPGVMPGRYDLAPLLRTGGNVIAVKASNNLAGPAGVFFAGRITYRSGKSLDFASDRGTLAAVTASEGWEQAGADEAAFSPARELAPRFGGPWGGGGTPTDVDATVAAWQKEWQRLFAAQSTLPEPVLIPRPKHLTWQGDYLPFVARGQGLVRFATPGAEAYAIRWDAPSRTLHLTAAAGQTVKLRFSLRNARLYSYRCSQSAGSAGG